MALREFADAGGRRWSVWEVNPDKAEALLSPAASRRAAAEPKPAWLAFECQSPPQRKRLTPYPPDWEQLSDEELSLLCEQAPQVPVRRRLIE